MDMRPIKLKDVSFVTVQIAALALIYNPTLILTGLFLLVNAIVSSLDVRKKDAISVKSDARVCRSALFYVKKPRFSQKNPRAHKKIKSALPPPKPKIPPPPKRRFFLQNGRIISRRP